MLTIYDKSGNELYKVSEAHFYALFEAYEGFFLYNFNSEATARIYVVKNYLEIVDIFFDL